MKVVICGPPHSGKSVFVSLLRALLPQERLQIVEGAPDGEGVTGWSSSASSDIVRAIRRKGKFLPKFVNWVCDSITNSTADITLVDVGGIRSPENERIFRAVGDGFIVISSKPEETAQWVEFGESLGLRPLAILDSTLSGEDEVVGGNPLLARITRLEREAPPVGSAAARAVADRIVSVAGKKGESNLSGEENVDVNFPRLAEELSLPVLSGTQNREWTPSILPGLLGLAQAATLGKNEVRLWGSCSAGFPYYTLAAGLASVRVGMYDPKLATYVWLPELGVAAQGNEFLDWRVEERNIYSLVEYVIPRQIFDAKDLPLVTPPTVTSAKGVVVSGKGPWWLTAALVRAYAHANVAWVAVFTPQESSRRLPTGETWSEVHPSMGPSVVVASSDSTIPIGTVVPFQL